MEAAEKKSAEKKATAPEPKFVKENLRKNCVKLFGVATSTFDGAMRSCESAELTVSEAKKMIDTWLKKPRKKKEV